MREIKFRVWDNDLKKMFYSDIEQLDNGLAFLIDGHFDDEMPIWMQYTGMLDTHGKEIYEGDILYKEGYWDMRIDYDDGCFMCRDADEVRYANLCFDQFISRVDLTGWEVIGNMYENPELLNKN